MSNRLETNREILRRLSQLVEQHPGMRFLQMLESVDIVTSSDSSSFYEESTVTLEKVKSKVPKIESDKTDGTLTLREASHRVVKEAIPQGLVNEYGQPRLYSPLGQAIHDLWKALVREEEVRK